MSEDSAAGRERRWLWTVSTTAVGLGLVPVLVSLLSRSHPFELLTVLIALAAVLVIVGGALAVVFALRRRGSKMVARSVLWELDRRDRKAVLRAIWRGTPVPTEHQDVALRAARQIADRPVPFWLFGVLLLAALANTAFQDGLAREYSTGVAFYLMFFTGYLAQYRQQARRAVPALEKQGKDR